MSLRQPTQHTVSYFSHTDTDAPQLIDSEGVIKTILKAGLVTGYGNKPSAGWAMPFEDANRMVLRTPMRTNNLPDIKIENGSFDENGATVTRHRIVGYEYEACTGLDDTNTQGVVNLLARSNTIGSEWHLIASDFGFILCYQIGENGYNGYKNYILTCSATKKLDPADEVAFVCNTYATVGENGYSSPWMRGVLDHSFTDMRTSTVHSAKSYLTINKSETVTGDLHAQEIYVGNEFILPFFATVSSQFDDVNTRQVSIENRPFLRYVNLMFQNYNRRALYIPLDYWEL